MTNELATTTEKLTKEQAVIISAYTGVLCCPFSDFQEAVEAKAGRPIWTHQFGTGGDFCSEKTKDLFKGDFLSICYAEEGKGEA